jgi:hypothetical protein
MHLFEKIDRWSDCFVDLENRIVDACIFDQLSIEVGKLSGNKLTFFVFITINLNLKEDYSYYL